MKTSLKRIVIVLCFITVLFFLTNNKGYLIARMHGYKALKVFAQVRNSEAMSDFLTYETENFIIRYTEDDENTVRSIARLFENSYYSLITDYNYHPTEKQLVFLYSDLNSMWKYQKSVDGQAVAGFYSMGIIHILSPNAYKGEKADLFSFFEKNGPILHEYTHKIVDDLSGGNIELWFTEGIALYEEYNRLGIEWAPDFKYEEYYSPEHLRNRFIELDEIQAYRQSFDIVKGLIETHGREKVIKVLDLLKSGYNIDKAFAEVYSLSVNEAMLLSLDS